MTNQLGVVALLALLLCAACGEGDPESETRPVLSSAPSAGVPDVPAGLNLGASVPEREVSAGTAFSGEVTVTNTSQEDRMVAVGPCAVGAFLVRTDGSVVEHPARCDAGPGPPRTLRSGEVWRWTIGVATNSRSSSQPAVPPGQYQLRVIIAIDGGDYLTSPIEVRILA